MRLILLGLIFSSFFVICHAGDEFIRIKTKKKKPAILLDPKVELIPIEKLKFHVPNLKREQIERRLRSGGDDVGNGGDEVRRKILAVIEQIKTEVGSGYQIPDLSTNGLITVKELKLNERPYPGVSTDSGIIIDRDIWLELEAKNIDLRSLVLSLIFPGDFEKQITIYSGLRTQSKKVPFCDNEPLSHKVIKTPHEQSFSGKDSTQTLSRLAIQRCQVRGLYECRIKETGKKGFLSGAKNFATYTGFEYKTAKQSRSELKKARCTLLKQCEGIFELAPMGQVPLKAFSTLEAQIEQSCF